MSKFMMVPRKLGEYHETFNEVSLDLVDLIRRERGEEDMFSDVTSLMNRWSFECESACAWYSSTHYYYNAHVPVTCQ